jgi:hypothetical protein
VLRHGHEYRRSFPYCGGLHRGDSETSGSGERATAVDAFGIGLLRPRAGIPGKVVDAGQTVLTGRYSKIDAHPLNEKCTGGVLGWAG